MSDSKSVLLEADSLVHGDRDSQYGHPLDACTRTARMWDVILDTPTEITAEQVALCLAALKIARQLHAPKRDNLVDLAGYAEVANMCIEEKKRRGF